MARLHASLDMGEGGPKKKVFGAHFSIPFRSRTSGARAGSADSSILEARCNGPAKMPRSRLRKSPPFENVVSLVRQRHSVDSPCQSHRGHKSDFPVIDVSQAWERDKQTGEIADHTDLLHSLVDQDDVDSVAEQAPLLAAHSPAESGEHFASRLPPNLWLRVLEETTPADAANLAFSCKEFRDLLGIEPWTALNNSDNHHHKIKFLSYMDKHLPGHLLCFTCATFHVRTQRGEESLKPANIANPLFNCPYSHIPKKTVSKTRLTFGRTLPFTFVQLALRAHHNSPDHGITLESLSRRYKDREPSIWSHQTRYTIVNGHLLMRVTSTCIAAPALPPAGLRHLLYSREDFLPYFSVCTHWRDGELMPMVKCAMSHIPKPPDGGGVQRVVDEAKCRLHPPAPIIILCGDCRPMRRCPECPTEYLIELKMTEDRSDPVNIFKQALVVTRWSDLGDGSTPWSPEWASINGESEFDSFQAIGRRAISGVFEAELNGDLIPGQRILSLNPNNEKLGEKGHNWY